ncbi:hypothetical protein C8J25_108153 [Sphingomonas faeni]|uniref:Uncharacterized protein n=1 Tax=Sphingomonas faeni TaxID=185950 RepID=A0A2T5U0N4_9SPHN|nr:hypothetical protein [Sphingomonas faeni]PTW45061.1 hypothetical protein C8J25_108153 [Sphingomonas faeni]
MMTTILSLLLLLSQVGKSLSNTKVDWGSVPDWLGGTATFAAVVVALSANRMINAQQRAQAATSRRINAEQITLKLSSIGDDLMVLRRHTVERIRTVDIQNNDEATRISYMDAVLGHSNEVVPRLSPSEASALISVGASALAMKFNLLAKRLAVHQITFAEYSKSLDVHEAALPAPTNLTIDAGVLNDTTPIDASAIISIRRRLANLESVSSAITKQVASDVRDAADLADEIGPFLKKIAPGQSVIIPDTAPIRSSPMFPKTQEV